MVMRSVKSPPKSNGGDIEACTPTCGYPTIVMN